MGLVKWLTILLVPLLLSAEPSEDWLLTSTTAESEGQVLPNLGMTLFSATRAEAEELQAKYGGKLYQSESIPLHLDKSVPAINADKVQQRTGNQRNGPTVLVIDTGIDSLHPDFQDGNVAAIVGPQGLSPAALLDRAGHGTHVASIVAGTGAGILGNGQYAGVYANGRVASYQAVDEADPSTVENFRVIQGMEWAIANKDLYDIRAVVNSWGAPGNFSPESPINSATRAVYEAGIVVTFSAGNEGGRPNNLNKFCKAPWVLCVAGASNDGRHEGYSSTGADKPSYNHPDISAPGSFITAATPILDPTISPLAGLNEAVYAVRTGTSMATPHVAAAAALLAAGNSDLSPDQIMDAIVQYARPMSTNLSVSGAGFLDVEAAYDATYAITGNLEAFLAGEQKYASATSMDSTKLAENVGSVSKENSGSVPAGLLIALGMGVIILLLLVLTVTLLLRRGRA